MLSAPDSTICGLRFESVLPGRMARAGLLKVKRFLRSPVVIVGEIVAITIAGVLGASIPQAGTASLEELARLRLHGPMVVALINLFALDHIFRSAWFLAITLLASASLSIVIVEQFHRLRVTWSQRLTETQFGRAPFRAEFERPAKRAAVPAEGVQKVEIRTVGRLGLAGSLVFHTGLLLVIFAGALRALFAVDAVVDLLEGETLAPTAAAWSAQWLGALAKPLQLDYPLRLDEVRATRYEAGELRELRVRVSLQRAEGVSEEEIAINRELRASGGRLFLGADFGPAALIEWQKEGAEPVRQAVLLAGRGKGLYEGASFLEGLIRVHLRAQVDRAGNHPVRLEVRVIDEERKALLFSAPVRVGDIVSLPEGQLLKLHGAPFWARLRGSRDPALWLAYAGFALALVGATIIFIIVKVDTCVIVTPAGERERVLVALRPRRFAPLFEERFRRLVREQGGAA